MTKVFTRLPKDTTPKTFSQWQELRRSNPRLYYSTEAQNRIASDLSALGNEKFFGTDGSKS